MCGLLLVLGGCASAPGAPGSTEDIAPFKGSFVAQGKMSLQPQADSKVRGFSASYRWEQQDARYDVEIWGALGQGRTRITGTADRITIVDGTGRTVKSRHPERLLRRHLGWSLPLAVLPYWMMGEAAPAPPAEMMRFQSNSDLLAMQQLGWDLEFGRYKDLPGAFPERRLPGRIRASRPDLKLTIVARDWRLDPGP